MSATTQRSSQERLWIIGGVLAAVVIALIGWVLLISPQRSDTDSVNSQADDVRASNLQLQSRIVALRAESKDMTGVKKALTAAQQALPSTSGVPDFLRSLQRLGSATGTDLVSLTVGQPTDVSTAAGQPAAPSSAAPSNSTPSGAPTAGKAVYALTISAQVNGAPSRLEVFLDKLQTAQPRAVLVTHITQGAAEGGSSLQLTLQAFVAPSSSTELSQLAQAAGK